MKKISFYCFVLIHPLKARTFSGGSHTETGGLSRSLYDCLSDIFIGPDSQPLNPFGKSIKLS